MKIIINIFAVFGFFIGVLFLLGSIGIGNFVLIYHGDLDNTTGKMQYGVLASPQTMDKQLTCIKNKE